MGANLILSNIHQYQVDDAACELLCYRAAAADIGSILVGPSSIEAVRKLSNKNNLQLFVSIAYPSGAYFADQKTAEIDELQSMYPEIKGFFVVSAVGKYISGYRDEIAEEMKQIRRSAGKRKLYYVTEASLLSDDYMLNLCDLTASAGIEGIVSTTGFAPYKIQNPTAEQLTRLVKASNKRLQVVAGACFSGVMSAEDAFSAGADMAVIDKIDDFF